MCKCCLASARALITAYALLNVHIVPRIAMPWSSLQEDVKDVRREVEVLNLVSDHGNVAALQATYEDAQHVHLVLELCRGGELFDRIISKGTFTEKDCGRCVPGCDVRETVPAQRLISLLAL